MIVTHKCRHDSAAKGADADEEAAGSSKEDEVEDNDIDGEAAADKAETNGAEEGADEAEEDED